MRARRAERAPQPALVTISDTISSQIVVGNSSMALQVTVDGGAALGAGPEPRPRIAREPRRLSVRTRPEPIGRAEVITRAVADLTAGRNVQLFGTPGVGRRAVAHAIVERLGAAEHTGVQLLDSAEPYTLGSLYTRLARHFFEELWYEPDEEMLRGAAEQAGVSGIVVIADCDLPAAEVGRLLDTFQNCVFLLTSGQQTLFAASGSAYEVDPLTLGQARELLARELAGDPASSPNAQIEQAHRLAEGQTQRLIEYASFLRSTARRPGPDPRQTAGLGEQIMLLISGFTEPARRVLGALAGFGVATPPELFWPLSGLGPVPAGAAAETGDYAGPQAAAVSELESSGLVVVRGESYAAAPDVVGALTAAGRLPDPRIAADGLLAFLAARSRSAEPPSALPTQLPDLCLAVARALRDAGAPDRASVLARSAAPAALAAGDVHGWIRLVALGVRCAAAADRPSDLEYFLREQHTSSLLRGDRAAAAAALAALAELLTAPVIPPGPAPVRRTGGQSPGRSLSRRAARLAAGLPGGAGAAVTTIAVVVVTITVVVFAVQSDLTHPSSDSIGSGLDGPVSPNTDCGLINGYGGGSLIATSGGYPCAQAFGVLQSYEALPYNEEGGTGQFATVTGWSCGQSSEGEEGQSGIGIECDDGNATFDTQQTGLLPTPAPTPGPAVWIIELESSPLTPLSGNGALFSGQAQYPQITNGNADTAQRQRVDAVLQQPVASWVESVTADGADTDLEDDTETTTVVTAGGILSIYYDYHETEENGGYSVDYIETEVFGTNTGTVIPQSDILSDEAYTSEGVYELTNAINETMYTDYYDSTDTESESCTSTSTATTDEISAYLSDLTKPTSPNTLDQMHLGVTQQGIEFDFTNPTLQACAPNGIVIPFDELEGLVNPSIPTLATAGSPAGQDTAPPDDGNTAAAPTLPAETPSPTPTAGPAAAVQAYIAAINAKDYPQAWALGGENFGGTYSAFAAGFDDTKQDTLTIVSVDGDVVTVELTSQQADGSQNMYSGTYTVTDGIITSASLTKTN